MIVFDKLKAIRISLGYSQAEASALSGIKQKDISLLESGAKKFIPNEYILFLYKNGVDINTIFDDVPSVATPTPNARGYKTTAAPNANEPKHMVSEQKTAHNVHPTSSVSVHPTVHPTLSLGLPKVVTVDAQNEELVALVNGKAAAGYLNGYGDPEYIERLPVINMPGLKGATHRAFEVVGHSMQPTLHNRAIAIGRYVENFTELRERYIYIVVSKTEGIVVKRVLNRINEQGTLILLSDNANKKDYPNIIVDAEDVKEIWKLRAALSFEFPEPSMDRINDVEARLTYLELGLKQLKGS